MWRVRFYLVIVMLTLFIPWCYAGTPHQVAGFELGAPISRYQDRLEMDTVLPVRHRRYLSEVETKDIPGFKSGYLTFGTCLEPHQIVRIRMKYANPTRSFFETLLKHFQNRFGQPAKYRGDAFQAFIAWKWSFHDRDGRRVSMILQHYSGEDEEYTQGNSVKLTLWSQVEAERLCSEKKTGAQGARKEPAKKSGGTVDFDFLVPK